MGSVLVVDGSDVCRAPIVAFTLKEALRTGSWLGSVRVRSRGLEADPGRTMCETAAARLGFSGPAISYFGAHRAGSLTVDDLAEADLILTAERTQRSAVVRMLPGIQAMAFTWKEALVLASVLSDRRRIDGLTPAGDLRTLARALHGARGSVPLIEPAVRTGVFHWRRPAETDPLSIGSGHVGQAEHRRVTRESVDVASTLGDRLLSLGEEHVPTIGFEPEARGRRDRRSA